MGNRNNTVLVNLKKKAPKVPDYTCQDIDNVLDTISSNPDIKAREYARIKKNLEALRRSNEALRESGIYWYDIVKGWLK